MGLLMGCFALRFSRAGAGNRAGGRLLLQKAVRAVPRFLAKLRPANPAAGFLPGLKQAGWRRAVRCARLSKPAAFCFWLTASNGFCLARFACLDAGRVLGCDFTVVG